MAAEGYDTGVIVEGLLRVSQACDTLGVSPICSMPPLGYDIGVIAGNAESGYFMTCVS
jgi:hypothetical protein